MTSTTSLKLPDEVKQLAIEADRHRGITPYAFMIDAIRTAAANADKRAGFVADALASRNEAVESRKAYAAEDVHAYLRARAQGDPAAKPKARTWHS